MSSVREADPAVGTRGARAVNRFLNRELSAIDFNARVLALAKDQSTPLLERGVLATP